MKAPDNGTFLREAIGIVVQESYRLYNSLPDEVLGLEKKDPRNPLRFITSTKSELRGMTGYGRDYLMQNTGFIIGQFLLLGQKIDSGEVKGKDLADLGSQFIGIFLGTPGMNLHIELLIKSIFGKMYISDSKDGHGSYASYVGPNGKYYTYIKRSADDLIEDFNEYFKPFLLKILNVSEQDLQLKNDAVSVVGTTNQSTTIKDLEQSRIGFVPEIKELKFFYDLLVNLDDSYLEDYIKEGSYSNIKISGNARSPSLLKLLGDYLYHVEIYKNDLETYPDDERKAVGLDMQAFENILKQKISLIKAVDE